MATYTFEQQFALAVETVAIFDVSDRGKIEVVGPDAGSFLHNLSTNDVKKLAVGSGCEAFFTTGQAKIVSHALIYRTGPESFWVDVSGGCGPSLFRHLQHFHITERLEIIDRTQEFCEFHLCGPAADLFLGNLASTLPSDGDFKHTEMLVGLVTCQVRRHAPLGLPGYELVCPVADGATLSAALQNEGASLVGREVYDVLRVEAGTPEYGVDIDESNLPQESGRTEQAVSFTKGCYIGQETIARIRTYGHVNRSLTGLRLGEKRTVPRGSKISRDGVEVGRVTSSVVSPRLDTGIALGYLRRGSSEPGVFVLIDAEGVAVPADVVVLPFVGGITK